MCSQVLLVVTIVVFILQIQIFYVKLQYMSVYVWYIPVYVCVGFYTHLYYMEPEVDFSFFFLLPYSPCISRYPLFLKMESALHKNV